MQEPSTVDTLKADLSNPATRPAAVKRLAQFPLDQIKDVLAVGHMELTADDVKAFPVLQDVWDRYSTFHFQDCLDRKNLDGFKENLRNVSNPETVEKLIRQLVVRIGDSRTEGKYEDMMEACLIKLMIFSDLKDGLKLEPELLRKCLVIVNRYFLSSNINRFLVTPHNDHNRTPLYRFMLRRLGSPNAFQDFDVIGEKVWSMDYAKPRYSPIGLQQVLSLCPCDFDAQKLFEAFLQRKPAMAKHMLEQFGEEIDVNAVVNGRSLLSLLIEACVEASKTAASFPQILVKEFVDLIDCFLARPDIVITQEDMEAAKGMNLRYNIRPTLYGCVHEVFSRNNFQKLRAAIAPGATEEVARGVNAVVVNLGDEVRQLELQEKMQLCGCAFLTDETKRFLIKNFPFGYLLMRHVIDTVKELSAVFAQLEALFALGAHPWDPDAGGVATLADYAKSKGLVEIHQWLLEKEVVIAAQLKKSEEDTVPEVVKAPAPVSAAAAADFGSPVQSRSVSTGGNSNNDERSLVATHVGMTV